MIKWNVLCCNVVQVCLKTVKIVISACKFVQIFRGQTLTRVLSHNGDVSSQRLYCMKGSWLYHTYLSPPGCYEQGWRWASGPARFWELRVVWRVSTVPHSLLAEHHRGTHAAQIFLRQLIYKNTSRCAHKGKYVCSCLWETANNFDVLV